MISIKSGEWSFEFFLCSENEANLLTQEKCDELMDAIINWAEKNNCFVGGGYNPVQCDCD